MSSLTQPGLLIVIIVLIHASFQAGVSVLTLLSGHSFRKKRAHSRVISLNAAYIIGAIGLSFLAVVAAQAIWRLLAPSSLSVTWLVIAIIMLLVGVAILSAYYRKVKGTVLWLPRAIAQYLTDRAAKTKSSPEALALGSMTVLAELPFSAILFMVVGLMTFTAEPNTALQLAGIYSIAICLPLMVMTGLIGGGHRISELQRWREQNKTFLQYSAGIGMLVAAIYVTIFYAQGGVS